MQQLPKEACLTAARAALEIALWVSTIAAWCCAVYLTADSGPM